MTSVTEPALSRNHTENMLRYMGAELVIEGTTVKMKGLQELNGVNIHVPGDISSAAFFLAAGLLVPNSKITLKNVGINETRTGILDALNMMGAEIKYKNIKNTHFEPVADLVVQTCKLIPVELSGDIIPRIIDEIPILVVLATQANGTTVIRNARELRVKETDRIKNHLRGVLQDGREYRRIRRWIDYSRTNAVKRGLRLSAMATIASRCPWRLPG